MHFSRDEDFAPNQWEGRAGHWGLVGIKGMKYMEFPQPTPYSSIISRFKRHSIHDTPMRYFPPTRAIFSSMHIPSPNSHGKPAMSHNGMRTARRRLHGGSRRRDCFVAEGRIHIIAEVGMCILPLLRY
jgi:hypothetical protein